MVANTSTPMRAQASGRNMYGAPSKQAPTTTERRVTLLETQKGSREESIESSKQPPRGGWILFFLVFGLAVGKDILDIFILAIELLGLLLAATVIGAPVGIGLDLFAQFGGWMAGLIEYIIFITYFAFIGGGFAARLAVTSIGSFIDAIPVLNFLPLTTLTFVGAFFAGRVFSKVTQAMSIKNKLVSRAQRIADSRVGRKIASMV